MTTNDKQHREQRGNAPPGAKEAQPEKEQNSSKAKKSSERRGDTGKQAFSIPTISLPKGGGAIRGIGEKFNVNAATGTGSLSVPIPASPGRSDVTPQLSLSYDSGAGNGPFGFGWSLGVPMVSRKTDKGLPRYDDDGESDVFILSGAEDLVPVLDTNGDPVRMQRTVHGTTYRIAIYRPRIEGLFARVERWTDLATGICHWRSITGDNLTTLYGYDATSRIADPADPSKVFSYLICRSFDDKGNVILYEYVAENGANVNLAQAHELNRSAAERSTQRYIKRVRYGNQSPWFADWSAAGTEPALPSSWHFEVVFDYSDHPLVNPTPTATLSWPVRPDPFSSHRGGFEVRTYRRCRRVLQFHHFSAEANVGNDCLVHSTDFHYSDENVALDPTSPIYTFLESVTQTGYTRNGSGYTSRSLPPIEFEYSRAEIQPDVLTLDHDDFDNLPEGIDGTRYQFIDLDGEGLAGILTDLGGSWGYHRNLSPINQTSLPGGGTATRARFGPMEEVKTLSSRSDLNGRLQLLDLAGDGQLDVVTFDDMLAGFFERTPDGSWTQFKPFDSLPHIDWADPNLRFIDLTGDGLADALITEDGVFTIYQSLGESGFTDAERVPSGWDEDQGPHVVFADGTQTMFLADMSGDGLSDIVRVRNGEISYWPNLGYGRFGSRVSMDLAPRFTSEERFDPKRVRLADIDGSGTTDVLYIGEDGVQVCFNRSGNSWSEPQLIAVFPTADLLSSVQVLDLLGNGTACLVWSSPLPAQAATPLLYVDLMGGVKPHLLIRSVNNLGAETRVEYAPSTRFYLNDKMAGRPWITKLPHVVHLVERVEIFDMIGRGRFVTRYAYHHGYFDGFEREFRGFGMVEQWDTEEHRDDLSFPTSAVNWDASSWVPPVYTKTWFHNGAFVEATTVSLQYESEYWAEPSTRGSSPGAIAARRALLLPDTVLPDGLTPDEIREAYRALKGSTLRIEIYAEDGTSRAEHPYTVTEQNFTVRMEQSRGRNRHAVFLTHPREALHYHYERRPSDPRITHNITLAVDSFGNATKTVAIGYGRRAGYSAPEPGLSSTFQSMLAHDQTRRQVTGTEQAFTSPIHQPWEATAFDVYHAPLPCEMILAELTGIAPTGNRFTFTEMDGHWTTLWSGTHDVPYEQVSTPDIEGVGTPTGLARRIVEHTRTLYRKDDLSALLPLGSLESHGLPGEGYQRALTSGLITRIFGTRVNGTILAEGGYVQLPGGSDWWIPTGRIYYSPGDSDTPAQELTEARAHFYIPRRGIDPFGAITRITYDGYDLLPTRHTDAVGNVVISDNDYRVLHPYRLTDPNGNFSQAAFDCLGRVTGTALSGKAGEGDSLSGFNPDLSDVTIQGIRSNPLGAPGTILGNATQRFVVDDLAYYRTRTLSAPEPPMVYTVARETHVSDLGTGGTTRFHHLMAYSDGFGREAQHKAMAEPGPVPGVGSNVSPRWVGSGWTIYNNKGNPVRRYEPFFTDTHEFEFDRQVGVSSVLFYDPLDRVVATLHPDSTLEKSVFDAWRLESWDQNDMSLISDPRTDPDVGDFCTRLFGTASGAFTSWYDMRIGGTYGASSAERTANQDAAQKTANHAATPASVHFDSLGRTCLAVADNGVVSGVDQRYATRTALDAESKPLTVIDALGRRIVEFCLREALPGSGFVYVAGYDMAGNLLYQNEMDNGERRILQDIHGETIRMWDARGLVTRTSFDALRRPTHR